jgi:NMD protein affecting ribosome stability and mRNA decay
MSWEELGWKNSPCVRPRERIAKTASFTNASMSRINRRVNCRSRRFALRPAQAHEEMCPACQRVRDQNPAGFLALSGRFLQEHKEEILNLVRNEEQDENAEHPLHRIVQIEEETDGIVITTTDLHLPRRIGDALHRAHQGETSFHYIEEGSIRRVHWKREV